MKFVYEWLLRILKYGYYHCMKMSMNGNLLINCHFY